MFLNLFKMNGIARVMLVLVLCFSLAKSFELRKLLKDLEDIGSMEVIVFRGFFLIVCVSK